IPDAVLTLSITGAVWAMLRLLDTQNKAGEGEPAGGVHALWLGVCLGAGLLLKGLIAVVFPAMALIAFLVASGQLLSWQAWRKLRLATALLVMLAVALPWHLLAIRQNPPHFAFSMHSGPGEYRGFFWFYFFNEHLLRFLNLRYPRDYNTVPR